MNLINHFRTITNHKLLVMKYCFKVGLYKQGLLHDLSKYYWVEFSAGIKYYRGDVSPNGIQKIEEGYSKAWLHHKGRNKHHLEYWIDYGVNIKEGLVGMKMPTKYVVEMFIDRMCASMNYQKEKYSDSSALEYYNIGKNHYILHKETRELLEFLLNKLAHDGEELTLYYIKNNLLKYNSTF
ncbi:DUF5662 family protein [Clostridium botulinum]|uniref:DUF5662 family protein n=1 Tax=Clostridium botulinum TaxID=1491 RepID=UPI000774B6CF|nr:DUF5662 family protein [Clostridium botulinum]NFE96636.1 catalase [Clostridium botulinum]NFL38474.1 catalase [Clostridium botulinum]NFN08482.1 catalase [Clostridium botulinum]NFN26617.1 catalase [Clostridium botulinum]NFN31730.1 catalase [Clostridium botulinum]